MLLSVDVEQVGMSVSEMIGLRNLWRMISVPVYVYSDKEEESTLAFDVMQFDCFICVCYQ